MKSIIMAGGSGTRLWPYSRKSFPKQFLSLIGEESFIGGTGRRLAYVSNENDVYVVAGTRYRFNIKNHLSRAFGSEFKNLILEPSKRNTAPAIALTMKYFLEKENCSEDEVLFFNTADHIISPLESFKKIVLDAIPHASTHIVTFGIIPDKPETGYGYIETGKEKSNSIYTVKRFVEKPDLKTAQSYLADGHYVWNSGMFLFSIKVMLEAFKKFVPELYTLVKEWSYDEALKRYDSLENTSVDYAVMEKTKNILCARTDIEWNDIGSWDSLYEVLPKDKNGNAILGDAELIDTHDSLIVSQNKLISVIGMKDTAIVSTPDATLISDRAQCQNVKEMVSLLENKKRPEAVDHVTTYRPWGSYTVLESGERYKIKRIVVNIGERLSLQRHQHRSEHWVVIKGSALVEIDGKEIRLNENESCYVPRYTMHRLSNPGHIPLEIIEVQNGEYVGEDDIERFEDNYGREKE